VLGHRHADDDSGRLGESCPLRRTDQPACQRSCFRLPGENGHVDPGRVRQRLLSVVSVDVMCGCAICTRAQHTRAGDSEALIFSSHSPCMARSSTARPREHSSASSPTRRILHSHHRTGDPFNIGSRKGTPTAWGVTPSLLGGAARVAELHVIGTTSWPTSIGKWQVMQSLSR
jgi:hypothetical protein